MKKILMVAMLTVAGVLLAQDKTMTLADARGKIGDVIKDPAAMTAVMSQLSAEDQVTFLADVNAAISKMPGSSDELAATFLSVNTAALKGAKEGNLTTLVAEVYATVPPVGLTVINESFAEKMFNRAANPSKTYTDAQFTAISKALVAKVQERTASADNAGVRNTFAILMMVRASNGSPTDLRDTLIDTMNDPAAKDLAQNYWVPAALGDGQDKSYEPMLAAADAGSQPNVDYALRVGATAADSLQALLSDLASENSIVDGSSSFVAGLAPSSDNLLGGADGTASLSAVAGSQNTATIPRTVEDAPWNPGIKRGTYGGQTTGN